MRNLLARCCCKTLWPPTAEGRFLSHAVRSQSRCAGRSGTRSASSLIASWLNGVPRERLPFSADFTLISPTAKSRY